MTNLDKRLNRKTAVKVIQEQLGRLEDRCECRCVRCDLDGVVPWTERRSLSDGEQTASKHNHRATTWVLGRLRNGAGRRICGNTTVLSAAAVLSGLTAQALFGAQLRLANKKRALLPNVTAKFLDSLTDARPTKRTRDEKEDSPLSIRRHKPHTLKIS